MKEVELYQLINNMDIPDRAVLVLHPDCKVKWGTKEVLPNRDSSYYTMFPMNRTPYTVSVVTPDDMKERHHCSMEFVSAINELKLPSYYSKKRTFGELLDRAWFKKSCYWHGERAVAVRVALRWIHLGVLRLKIDREDFSHPLDWRAVYDWGKR